MEMNWGINQQSRNSILHLFVWNQVRLLFWDFILMFYFQYYSWCVNFFGTVFSTFGLENIIVRKFKIYQN